MLKHMQLIERLAASDDHFVVSSIYQARKAKRSVKLFGISVEIIGAIGRNRKPLDIDFVKWRA